LNIRVATQIASIVKNTYLSIKISVLPAVPTQVLFSTTLKDGFTGLYC